MKQTEKNTYTEEEIEELKKWFENQQLPEELALDKATYIPNLRDTLDRLLEQANLCCGNPKMQGCIILLERIREIRASERRAYQKIADVFEQCSYDYDKNSETTKAFYAFVQNKLHYAVTGKTAAELLSQRATLDSPTMGLTTWKGAPDGKILKSDTLVAKNYLNQKELSRLNRLVTMFIDYAELMAEDEQLMSMQDWLKETDRFLTNNRRQVLDDKGRISREAAVKKVSGIYEEFRKRQDADYISEFDRQTEKYLKGE